jgi:quercetin dioxygenase-like cupin family protein
MEQTRLEPVVRVPKDWGYELWITNTPLYCCKLLLLDKGWQCSLHHHKVKHETFHILSGLVRLELGSHVIALCPGNTVAIPPGTKHRFSGLENSEILEMSTFHSDEDVFRDEPSKEFS